MPVSVSSVPSVRPPERLHSAPPRVVYSRVVLTSLPRRLFVWRVRAVLGAGFATLRKSSRLSYWAEPLMASRGVAADAVALTRLRSGP